MGWTKAKRIAAAKKAARTRKKNAEQKNRNRNGSKVVKKKKIALGKISPKVSSHIENTLKGQIINDMKNHTISNEADLQFSVVYHLKQFLNQYENIRISSQLPIRIKSKDSDIFVDVVISTVVHGFSEISPFVAIELKERQEFSENDMRNDIEKLQKLKQNKVINYGYQIFICRSQYPEKVLQDEAYGCVKSKYIGSITPIVINIYDHISGTDKITFDKRWDQSRRYYHDIATEHVAARTRKRRNKKK